MRMLILSLIAALSLNPAVASEVVFTDTEVVTITIEVHRDNGATITFDSEANVTEIVFHTDLAITSTEVVAGR